MLTETTVKAICNRLCDLEAAVLGYADKPPIELEIARLKKRVAELEARIVDIADEANHFGYITDTDAEIKAVAQADVRLEGSR